MALAPRERFELPTTLFEARMSKVYVPLAWVTPWTLAIVARLIDGAIR
jgi:hypothetical protein